MFTIVGIEENNEENPLARADQIFPSLKHRIIKVTWRCSRCHGDYQFFSQISNLTKIEYIANAMGLYTLNRYINHKKECSPLLKAALYIRYG